MSPNIAKTIAPVRAFFEVATPVAAPMSKLTTTIPATRAGLSFVPKVSIAHRSTEPGTFSMAMSPTRRTSDGTFELRPDRNSPIPSATPPATMPLIAARR